MKKLTKKCKRGHFSPINPADIMPEKSVHASTEEQLAVTQLCPQHSKGSVSTGGSYSSLMCMKKVGLGAPPGTVLPPEIHYGGLACLQSFSRSQLKQAFVLNWFLCRSLAWSGTWEGLLQESRSRCPEPRNSTVVGQDTESITHCNYPESKHPQKRSRNNQEDWMASPSIPKGIQWGRSKANNNNNQGNIWCLKK